MSKNKKSRDLDIKTEVDGDVLDIRISFMNYLRR